VLADYVAIIELVMPDLVPRVVIADPDDDHVIAAAVAAQAGIIVSGDKRLLELRTYQEIRIMAPAQALERIGAAMARE
jgi:predicted nucleic acid-binding protein